MFDSSEFVLMSDSVGRDIDSYMYIAMVSRTRPPW